MAEPRIDVSIEHKHRPDNSDGAGKHPNTCPSCGSHYRNDELEANLRVCPQCGHHFPVRARERIEQLVDTGTFQEEAVELRSEDPLGFFDLRPYTERLAEAEVSTGLGDAMVIGERRDRERGVRARGHGLRASWAARWAASSARSLPAPRERRRAEVPLVAVTASGGARMQEGILSLMQLPKTVCAIEDLRDARCGFISVMTHPTTAGVLASFASLGDIIVSEPGALLAFTGPRVVQQTTREKLPADFGLAESNLRFGHLDAILPRTELRPFLGRTLRLFSNGR